ncbi:MAG: DUF2341 domain-containing protein [Candidatus Woesearchaeota archaeon]
MSNIVKRGMVYILFLLVVALVHGQEVSVDLDTGSGYAKGDSGDILASTSINGIKVLSIPMELEVTSPDGFVERFNFSNKFDGNQKLTYEFEHSGEYVMEAIAEVSGVEYSEKKTVEVAKPAIDFNLSVDTVLSGVKGNITLNGGKVDILLFDPSSKQVTPLCNFECTNCSFSCDTDFSKQAYTLIAKATVNGIQYMRTQPLYLSDKEYMGECADDLSGKVGSQVRFPFSGDSFEIIGPNQFYERSGMPFFTPPHEGLYDIFAIGDDICLARVNVSRQDDTLYVDEFPFDLVYHPEYGTAFIRAKINLTNHSKVQFSGLEDHIVSVFDLDAGKELDPSAIEPEGEELLLGVDLKRYGGKTLLAEPFDYERDERDHGALISIASKYSDFYIPLDDHVYDVYSETYEDPVLYDDFFIGKPDDYVVSVLEPLEETMSFGNETYNVSLDCDSFVVESSDPGEFYVNGKAKGIVNDTLQVEGCGDMVLRYEGEAFDIMIDRNITVQADLPDYTIVGNQSFSFEVSPEADSYSYRILDLSGNEHDLGESNVSSKNLDLPAGSWYLQTMLHYGEKNRSFIESIDVYEGDSFFFGPGKNVSITSGETALLKHSLVNELSAARSFRIKVPEEVTAFIDDGDDMRELEYDGSYLTGELEPYEKRIIFFEITPVNDTSFNIEVSSEEQSVERTDRVFIESYRDLFADLDLYQLTFENGTIVSRIRNNNDRAESFDLELNIFGSSNITLKANATVPADSEITIEKDIFMKRGLVKAGLMDGKVPFHDTDLSNNNRSLVFGKPDIPSADFVYRIPVSEREGREQYDYMVRVNLDPSGIDLSSIGFVYLDHEESFLSKSPSFRVLDTRPFSLIFPISRLPANRENTVYLYYNHSDTQDTESFMKEHNSKVEWDSESFIDNTDTNTIGRWVPDYGVSGYHGMDYLHDLDMGKGEKFVVYPFDYKEAGYELYYHSPVDSSFSRSTKCTVNHKHGTDTFSIDQTRDDVSYLGMYDLDEDSSLVIHNTQTKGVVVADAFRLIRIDHLAQPELETWDGPSNMTLYRTLSNTSFARVNVREYMEGNLSFEAKGLLYEFDDPYLNLTLEDYFGKIIVEGHNTSLTIYVSKNRETKSKVVSDIEIGKPVKWRVPLDGSAAIPNDVENISSDDVVISVDGKDISVSEFRDLKKAKRLKGKLKDMKGLGKSFARSKVKSEIEELERNLPNVNITKNLTVRSDSLEFVEYTTSAPKLKKLEDKEALSRVKVYSNVSMHYHNITSYTDIPATAVKPRLYHVIEGKRHDITNDDRYNVTFYDTDGDDLYDHVRWIVPQLSEQYFEVGVATINTNKSLYHPGETARIMAAVLDNEGYLVSDADVHIRVTDPYNSTVTFSDVTEVSQGIYAVNYDTTYPGDHEISVHANASGVNNSMYSMFKVKEDYEFDIIRDVPMATDPWKGSFRSEITIYSTSNETFSFIERLPENLSLTEAKGADISQNGTYLEWSNLTNGSVVEYYARPPLVAPDVYELGPAQVRYGNVTFEEARPWYLAIDPLEPQVKYCTSITTTGTATNDNTGTCAQVNASDDVNPAGGDNALEADSDGGNAVAVVTFDSNSNPYYPVVDAKLTMEWAVEDTGGNTCAIDINNGSGWHNIHNDCTGHGGTATSDIVASYDVSAHIPNGEVANGFQVRLTYAASADGAGWDPDTTDELYFDHVMLDLNLTSPPGYSIWGLNVSNGDDVVRGENILAYAYWNYTDGISDALLEHDGSGSYTNYTIPSPYTADWTNYTMDTSNTTRFAGVGRVTVSSIHARDVDGYKATSPSKYFYLYGYSNISESTLSSAVVNESESATFSCRVLDNDLGTPILDYTVYFYKEGVYMTSVKTDSTGWADYTDSYDTPGTSGLSCSISDSGYYIANANESSTSITVHDHSVPSIDLLSPDDNVQDIDGNITFVFNVSDEWSGIDNCSLVINGSVNHTGPASEVGNNSIDTMLPFGVWEWNINCTDDSVNNNEGSSEKRIINVAPDTTPPSIDHQEPPDGVDTGRNVTLIFNATDELSNVSSCTLIFDGIENQTESSIVDGEWISMNLTNLDSGIHTWRVNCSDDSPAENWDRSSTWTFNVGEDKSPPDITLYSPENDSIDTDGNVSFIYNASDFMSDVASCSLYINGSLNQTSTSINDSTQSFFIPDMAEGDWYYFINCTDNSANSNTGKSEVRYFTVDYDFLEPDVTLIDPLNYFSTVTGDITFTYNVTDESSIDSCSLIIDGMINKTDDTISKNSEQTFSLTGLSDGNYTWAVNCTDASDGMYTGGSETRNFSVGPDEEGPVITLFAPINDSVDTDGSVSFTYKVVDATSGIDSCKLYVDGTIEDTDTSVLEDEEQSLSATLGDGMYDWNINCTDDSPQKNMGSSEVRILNVSITYETDYSITMDDHYVSQGEYMQADVYLEDGLGSSITGADAYGYIIRNPGVDNQTLPWTNSSFPLRKEIPLTNTGGEGIQNAPVSLTLDTASIIAAGDMDAACNDLRFGDQGNYELDYYFWDADTGCDDPASPVLVKVKRVWPSATNRIGMYYGNAAASSSENRDAFPVVDNFDDGDTFASNYWGTVYSNADDEWEISGASAYDGGNAARSQIYDEAGSSRDSSFGKEIEVTANSTLHWHWRVSSGNAQLTFYLDGTAVDTTTSTTYVAGSQAITPGTHTIRWEFNHPGDGAGWAPTTYSGFADQIYLVSDNIVQGTTTSESEFVETLVKQTTDSNGRATLAWDTRGFAAGDYSITGYGSKGSYWEDNGFFNFRLGPDIESPWYTEWGLNISDGDIVVRNEKVKAYSYWHDLVNLSSGLIQHTGEGTENNYSIAIDKDRSAWANYTLDTASPQFTTLGRVNVTTIHVNDSSDNWNKTSPVKYFRLFSTSELNDSALNMTAVSEGNYFNASCHVRDEFDNTSIQGYNVSFYLDGNYKGEAVTDATGWAELSIQATSVGDNTPVLCKIIDQPGINYYSGEPYNLTTYIDVTDMVPPNVTAYNPGNDSLKTVPNIAMGFHVYDAGELDSCELYGNWSGWHLNQTMSNPENGGFPNINYFSAITLLSGNYSWYVTCNDTNGNRGTSKNFTFDVYLVAPTITLLHPPADHIGEPGDYDFNYTVSQPDDEVGIDNCSLYIDGVLNQTDYMIPKDIEQSFSVNDLDYGEYEWRVECSANNTLDGAKQRNLYLYDLNITGPLNDTKVDRDNISGYPDSIKLVAEELSGSNDTEVIFKANMTDPALGEVVLGSNFTSSGVAELNLNPNSSILAGNYTWWAEFADGKRSLDQRRFSVYGGVNLRFENPVLDPDPVYEYNDNVTINVSADSIGDETENQLINSYGLAIDANLSNDENHYSALGYAGSVFTGSVNTTILKKHGEWNVSMLPSLPSRYLVVNSTESRTFFLNVTGYGIPAISLNYPPDNTNVTTTSIDFNWTANDSVEDIVSCNLTINGTVNASNITSNSSIPKVYKVSGFSPGTYDWNVTCWDIAGNVNTSATYNFTVPDSSSDLVLTHQDVARVYRVINFTANYTNADAEGIDGNCSINFSDGITANLTFNTTGNDAYSYSRIFNSTGTYIWNVDCNHSFYAAQSETDSIFINRSFSDVVAPVNGTKVDRDGSHADSDTITIISHIPGDPQGVNMTFFLKQNQPFSKEPVMIGHNVTDMNGNATLTYDPPSSLYAGNYTIFSNSTYTDNRSVRDSFVIGSLDLEILSYPEASYEHNSTVPIHVNITSGHENYSELYYNYSMDEDLLAFMEATTIKNDSFDIFLMNEWNSSIFINVSDEKGTWNLTVNHSSSYFYPVSDSRTVNITAYLTNISIWDQYDAKGGFVDPYVYENLAFYANYTDSSGVFLSSANCNFSFDDGTSFMGSEGAVYEYLTKQFTEPGSHSWNVTCNLTEYEAATSSTSIRVYPKTNVSLAYNVTSVADNRYDISILITNQAYPETINAYDYVPPGFEDHSYSYGPNETYPVNGGNATKFNISVVASEHIDYSVNGSGDYSPSWLYMFAS